MRRIGIGSGSLVSNTAGSLAGIELSQLGADVGLGPPARLAIPPSYPNSGIFPLTARTEGTERPQNNREMRYGCRLKIIGGLKLAVAAGA